MVGKTRMAVEIIKDLFSSRRIVVPDSKSAFAKLNTADIVLQDAVIWLDDIDTLIGVDGITEGTLWRLVDARNAIVATIRAGEYARYIPTSQVRPQQWDVISVFERVFLDRALSEEEENRLNGAVKDPQIREQIRRVGLGEYVGAARRIDEKLGIGPSVSPVGYALVLGSVAWRRTGMTRPIPASALPDLAYPYLDARGRSSLEDDEAYAAALAWATEEINPTVSLLQPSDGNTFTIFDYALDVISNQSDSMPDGIWGVVIGSATPPELVTLGYLAKNRYDASPVAERAWRIAISTEHADAAPAAAYNLGDLLREQHDVAGARTAYSEAAQSSNPQVAMSAATRLAELLAEQGDAVGANAAYKMANESRRLRFVFANAVYTEPVTLAAAFRYHWNDAHRLLAGQREASSRFLALRDWLQALGISEAVTVLEQSGPPDRLLAQLLAILDPESPPEFRGRVISKDGLLSLAKDAEQMDGSEQAADLIDAIYKDGILTVYDDVLGCDGYALLDDRWHGLIQIVEDWFASYPGHPQEEPEWRATRATLLLALLEPQHKESLAHQAEVCLQDPRTTGYRWLQDLKDEYTDPDLEAARYRLITLMHPRAIEESARKKRLQRRHRIIAVAATLMVVLAVIATGIYATKRPPSQPVCPKVKLSGRNIPIRPETTDPSLAEFSCQDSAFVLQFSTLTWAGYYISVPNYVHNYDLQLDARMVSSSANYVTAGWGYGVGVCDTWEGTEPAGFIAQYAFYQASSGVQSNSGTFPMPYVNDGLRLPIDSDYGWHHWILKVRNNKVSISLDYEAPFYNNYALTGGNLLPANCSDSGVFLRVLQGKAEFQNITIDPR